MVVGEAMANGAPCVAVNEGGAPETVTDGIDGVRVPNDPVLFGEAVVKLLNDPEKLLKMREAAVSGAVYRTPEHMGAKVISVYKKVLSEKANGKR
jgi:glycosyltransferase involved in cell wall biosynthesis